MASRHRSKHGHIALAVLDEHVMAPWRLPRPRAVCTAVIIPGHPHAAAPHARTAGSDVVDDIRRSAEEGIAVELEGPSSLAGSSRREGRWRRVRVSDLFTGPPGQ